jgi:hypothetical protein
MAAYFLNLCHFEDQRDLGAILLVSNCRTTTNLYALIVTLAIVKYVCFLKVPCIFTKLMG